MKRRVYRRPHPERVEGRGRPRLTSAALLAALIASSAVAQTATPPPLQLRLADVGRFATFVDLGSVEWTGRVAKLRVLQVTEGGFTAGAEAFWGGWRHEIIDCDARTIAHAAFSSIRAGGREGPLMGEQRPPGPIAPGGADAATAKVVCEGWKPFAKVPLAGSIEEAVKLGRPLIETGAEP